MATGNGLIGNNMFAYCGNNPVNRTDNLGEDWLHWAVAAAIVVAAAAAVVITAGAGITGAVVAITSVANGVAASTTGATIAAGVFIGSATALGTSAYAASIESNSWEDFAAHGESAMYSTMIGGGFGGASAYAMDQSRQGVQCPSECFVAGTLILTLAGDVPIETITPGDYVWAWDEESGDVALKEVVEIYVNESDILVHLFVNSEEIITTPGHPFYSPVKGWTDADDLCAGDVLVLISGQYVVVDKVVHEFVDEPVSVYNFQVKDYHTYFVSSSAVLVHNKCVARDGTYRADVRVGGDPNHAVGHAHIWEGSDEIASIDVNGNVLAGELSRGAKKFVQKYLPQIADGIIEYYYK